MIFFRPFFVRPLVAVLMALAFSPAVRPQSVMLTPLKASGIYEVGEKIAWEVTVPAGQAVPSVNYTLKKNGLTAYKTETLDLSTGKAAIATSLDEPGAVLLEIQLPPAPEPIPAVGAEAGQPAPAVNAGRGGRGRSRVLAGALVAPRKLQPSSPRPVDFDEWWTAKIAQLHAIPANPEVTATDGGVEGVEYSVVQMDNINGTHIYGQLAKPKRPGKFPAVLSLQWAGGPYPLQKPWVTARAAEGWLAFNIEPHDLPGDRPAEFYRGKIRGWETQGDEDREQSYFLRMYLSAYRAADFLTAQPEWDGKTLVIKGDSMGGQQTLIIAGLYPKVTAMMALVPSSCDVTGPVHGRAAGFPDWARDAAQKNNPKILEAAQYFDPVNFASRIKVPALVAMGFIDETCPPTGAWVAINQMKGPVEALPLIDSPHQDNPKGVQAPYQKRSAEWLATLVKGEAVTIKP